MLKAIDLHSLGIENVSDLRSSGDQLFLLEVYLAASPEKYFVYQLSLDGAITASYEIPADFHLENGLSGIAVNPEGTIYLELEWGNKLFQLEESNGYLSPIRKTGYSYYHKTYGVIVDAQKSPIFAAEKMRLTTTLTYGMGGFLFLDAFPDGDFIIIRDDVVNNRVVQVDETVHLLNEAGAQKGIARFPLSESYYPVNRRLAVGPNKRIYGLLPQRDSIKIIRLRYYAQLDSLISEAVQPLIMVTSHHP